MRRRAVLLLGVCAMVSCNSAGSSGPPLGWKQVAGTLKRAHVDVVYAGPPSRYPTIQFPPATDLRARWVVSGSFGPAPVGTGQSAAGNVEAFGARSAEDAMHYVERGPHTGGPSFPNGLTLYWSYRNAVVIVGGVPAAGVRQEMALVKRALTRRFG